MFNRLVFLIKPTYKYTYMYAHIPVGERKTESQIHRGAAKDKFQDVSEMAMSCTNMDTIAPGREMRLLQRERIGDSVIGAEVGLDAEGISIPP